MKINAKIQIDADKILRERGLGNSGKARIVLAKTAAHLAQPYIPYDTGSLSQEVQIAQDGSSICYTAPYAAAQYYGQFQNYHNNGGGLRGRQWIKRMLADKKSELADAVARMVGGKAQ